MNYFSSSKTRGFSIQIPRVCPVIFFFGATRESMYVIMKAQRKNIFEMEKHIIQLNSLPF